jgi:hypothetical protein
VPVERAAGSPLVKNTFSIVAVREESVRTGEKSEGLERFLNPPSPLISAL